MDRLLLTALVRGQRSEVVHLEAAAEADEKKPTTPTTDDEA